MGASGSAALAAAAVALLAGCGGGGSRSDPEAAAAAVTSFSKAFGAGDGKRGCDLLTNEAQAALVKRVQVLSPARDCPTALERIHAAAGPQVAAAFSSAKVAGKARVRGDSATVILVAAGHSSAVPLSKRDGEWKLTGFPGL